MADPLLATPLIALDAVALDTETTGLDVRKARLIEIGLIPVRGAALQRGEAWASLADPGEPVPASSSAVHGIRDGDLKDQPAYAALHAGIVQRIAGHVVVGHTIGFDLALLKREAERCGASFRVPYALDVRLLAQLAAPGLSGYSLEALASWLDVTPATRHRALGDAETAALIFIALMPKLREAGVRTLGEALAGCRKLSERPGSAQPLEWEITPQPAADALPRLDSYPYSHRVRDVMASDPLILPADTVLAEALNIMATRRFSSVLVGDSLADASSIGILTERDVLRVIARGGGMALGDAIGSHASRPLLTVPADALIYRAIGRMTARNLRHLAVVDADDRVVGIVTTRDLLRLRATSAIALGDDIDSAPDVPSLARAWAKLPAVARALVAESVGARDVAAVIAREVGALTRRAAQLAEAELAAAGAGGPPCDYAVMVLGSAGRGESLLAMDQDNALIFAHGQPDGPEDRWFAQLGARMCAILHEVGVPLCPGGVMAREPAFRGSVETWRTRISEWLTRSRPEDLLAVDIVFDARPVHGRLALATGLMRDAWGAAARQTAFLKLMAQGAGDRSSWTTLLGRIRSDEDGRIDLKRAALLGLVSTARVLAIKRGLSDRRATRERLAALAATGHGGASDLARMETDHALVMQLILEQQLRDIGEGLKPGSRVEVKRLDGDQTGALKAALGHQSVFDTLLRDQLSD